MNLCLVIAVSMTPSLWSQVPTENTFADFERRATGARRARDLDRAVGLYREALKVRPNWNEGRWYLGTSLYGLGFYVEASHTFRELTASEPGNGPAWALAGMCEFELKNYEEAMNYLQRSEKSGLGETAELAYLVRFRVALLLNRSGKSEQALGRMVPIAAQARSPEIIQALGLVTLRSRLLPSEIPEVDRELYERGGEAMYAYINHDSEAAFRLFQDIVNKYPDRPNVHYARGTFLLEVDPEKALEEFQRELQISASHTKAMTQVAELYLKQGAPEKALPYAQRATKAEPNDPAAHTVLGQCLLGLEKFSPAISQLRIAVRLAPGLSLPHFLLAQAYTRLGDDLSAKQEMAEFQRLKKIPERQSSKATEN